MTEEVELPEFARNLQALMKNALMRQSDVAKRAGIPRDAFGRYYHGHNRPPPLKTAAMARVLGCSPRDIDPELSGDFKILAAEGAPIVLSPHSTLPKEYSVGPARDGDPRKMRLYIDADISAEDVIKILGILSSKSL